MILTNGVKLIGICGKSGSGKDTAAHFLYTHYANVYTESFASPLKKACAAMFGMHEGEFHHPEFKEKVNEFWGVSPRQIAQFVGTECVRELLSRELLNNLGPDFWIKRLFGLLSNQQYNSDEEGTYTTGDTVILTDIRFQNEYDFVVNNGGHVIFMCRDMKNKEAVGIPGHASEELKIVPHAHSLNYFLFNNSTIEDLHTQLKIIADTILDLESIPPQLEF